MTSLQHPLDSILFGTCLLCKIEKHDVRQMAGHVPSAARQKERRVACIGARGALDVSSDSSNVHIISSYPASHVHLSIHVRRQNLSYLSLLPPRVATHWCLATLPFALHVLTAGMSARNRSSCVPYALGVSFISVCSGTSIHGLLLWCRLLK